MLSIGLRADEFMQNTHAELCSTPATILSMMLIHTARGIDALADIDSAMREKEHVDVALAWVILLGSAHSVFLMASEQLNRKTQTDKLGKREPVWIPLPQTGLFARTN